MEQKEPLKEQVIRNLENAISILKTFSYWEPEVRTLTEIVGMVKKSEGQV